MARSDDGGGRGHREAGHLDPVSAQPRVDDGLVVTADTGIVEDPHHRRVRLHRAYGRLDHPVDVALERLAIFAALLGNVPTQRRRMLRREPGRADPRAALRSLGESILRALRARNSVATCPRGLPRWPNRPLCRRSQEHPHRGPDWTTELTGVPPHGHRCSVPGWVTGRMVEVTIDSPNPGQASLFGEDDPTVATAQGEPVLMALHVEYYELIWERLKTHEFRRRFLEGRAAQWFVYLNAPVSRLAAVIDLGPTVVDTPDRIAAIAERTRAGNGASVLEYVRDLDRAYAIPILRVREYPELTLEQVRAELGEFHPPQGYVRLRKHPGMLAMCEKVMADSPTREIIVHHQ
jgi:predicted transcriptional regulator